MPNTDHHQAIKVAEKIQEAMVDLQIEHQSSDVSEQVTLSIGIACAVPAAAEGPTHLVKMADTALYEAKIKGRNQIVVQRPNAVERQPT